jgi:ribosomal protein S18 acetylase RimI-like enzyme
MARLRIATAADVDAVVDLWQQFGGPTRSPPRAAPTTRLLARDPDALILAVDDERIVGSVIVGWDGWRCHLYRLVVRPEARRAGIADALVAAARDRARDLGASRVDAMVHDDNDGAVAFWRAAGFELQDDDRRWSAPT